MDAQVNLKNVNRRFPLRFSDAFLDVFQTFFTDFLSLFRRSSSNFLSLCLNTHDSLSLPETPKFTPTVTHSVP